MGGKDLQGLPAYIKSYKLELIVVRSLTAQIILIMSAAVPIQVIHGAQQKTLPIAATANSALGDIHHAQTETSAEKAHLTSGFYRITPGPPKPFTYDFEEAKIVLQGEIDIKDVTTGTVHHVTPGDYVFFPVGSSVEFSTKSEGFAFYVVTRKFGYPY